MYYHLKPPLSPFPCQIFNAVSFLFVGVGSLDTLPTLHVIEGAKFEISSLMSQNFQVSHSLTWGSSQAPPSYNFSAGYQGGNVCIVFKLLINEFVWFFFCIFIYIYIMKAK